MLLFVPAKQSTHVDLLSFGTSPASQKVQEEDPGVFEIFPTEQIEHESVPPTENLEIGHSSQVLVAVLAKVPRPQ